MSSRKVEIVVKVKLKMIVNEGIEISDVVDDMDYDFADNTSEATVEDMEIVDYELIDSK